MFAKSFVLVVGCSTLAFGCAGNSNGDETQETIDNLMQAGYPASDIQLVDGKVYVGRDAQVTLQASREMLESSPGHEQYRTSNLVAGPNPAIVCVNGAPFTDATLSAGLNGALSNYNDLFQAGKSRLFFFRISGTSFPGCTFVINSTIENGVVGGDSGFPSGGAPFGQINIGTGVIQFGSDVAKHVVTHEIGHTIGFRHSDYFDRSISCGPPGGDEGDAGVGAILIPGTPSDATDGGSIMNSCFHGNEPGEFSASDVTAVDALY